MNSNMPEVSVIMPVYNADLFVKEAIESILNQTFTDFEFIIIDDGSVDFSHKYIDSYKDKRIRYFQNPRNKGIIHTLNRGLELANGKYIARMDADDIALPSRLEKQVDFLEKNKNISIIGTQVNIINSKGKIIHYPNSLPTNSVKLKSWAVLLCPFSHPTIMAKSEVIKKFKYPNDNRIEDYALWIKILKKYEGSNLDEVLLHYRHHEKKNSASRKDWYHESAKELYRESIKLLPNIELTNTEINILSKISGYYSQKISFREAKEINNVLKKIETGFFKENKIQKQDIRQILDLVWFETIYQNIPFKSFSFLSYYSSSFAFYNRSIIRHLKLVFKSFFRK